MKGVYITICDFASKHRYGGRNEITAEEINKIRFDEFLQLRHCYGYGETGIRAYCKENKFDHEELIAFARLNYTHCF